MNTLSYYNSLDLYSSITFGKHFSRLLGQLTKPEQTLIFLCIGSDRATGDSLGPLIGHKLKLQQPLHPYLVYGTLEEPVHAKNLETTMELIHRRHKNPFIIAIDASLGSAAHIGYYTLAAGSLKPGAGVGKDLITVGDVSITGIVNLSGLLDHMLLQTTRLHTVMSLAERISFGIGCGIRAFYQQNASTPLQLYTPVQCTQ